MTGPTAQVERAVLFTSLGQPAFRLEGIIHEPTVVQGTAPLVVFCHPQPASSDMRDSLTVALARAVAEAGMIGLRFNFRGVGNSQGQQTDGRLEALDLAGAGVFGPAQPGVNLGKVCVGGHAFGAYIALQYAPFDPHIRTLVAISLPLYRTASGFPRPFERPKLFVTGEFDEVCPRYKLEPFVEQQKGPKRINVITGARHLMRGYEDAATNAIMKYLKRWGEMHGVDMHEHRKPFDRSE